MRGASDVGDGLKRALNSTRAWRLPRLFLSVFLFLFLSCITQTVDERGRVVGDVGAHSFHVFI